MIEIIPNWHPLAVHFPIALVCTSTLFFVLGIFLRADAAKEVFVVSRWCLWLASILAVITALLGWQAYNSVVHDAASHAAMTLHKDWAIPTATFIVFVGMFSYVIRHQWGKQKVILTTLLLMLASALTSSTAWLGAESVYRHGIGVMRIPDVDGHDHSGGMEHGQGKNHHTPMKLGSMPMKKFSPPPHGDHNEGQSYAP